MITREGLVSSEYTTLFGNTKHMIFDYIFIISLIILLVKCVPIFSHPMIVFFSFTAYYAVVTTSYRIDYDVLTKYSIASDDLLDTIDERRIYYKVLTLVELLGFIIIICYEFVQRFL